MVESLSNLLVREILAAFEGCFAELDGFNKAGFFCQVAADRLLRKRIGIPASLGGQRCEFLLLLWREMDFHRRSVRAHLRPVNGPVNPRQTGRFLTNLASLATSSPLACRDFIQSVRVAVAVPHVSICETWALAAETSPRHDYGRTCPKNAPRAAVEISPFHLPGDTVTVEHDPLAEAMRFLLDAQSSVQGVSL